jgi:integrase
MTTADREVAPAVEAWHSSRVPPEAVAFARQAVAAARPVSTARAKALLYAASRAAAFAMSVGLELRAEVVLHPSVVERLVLSGPKFSGPTRRTLRTNLRALARSLEAWPAPLPVALPRERCKAPYGPAEISGYLALADAQPTASRRLRAQALVCLGAGAGLVGTDLRNLRGTDVVERSGGVLVEVRGARARTVPVLARFASRLLECAAATGDGFVLGGTHVSRHNVTTPLVRALGTGNGLPRLEVARLRATWLEEVARAIGLGAFMAAAGVSCSQRLGDVASRLPVLGEEEAVVLLGGTRARGES